MYGKRGQRGGSKVVWIVLGATKMGMEMWESIDLGWNVHGY